MTSLLLWCQATEGTYDMLSDYPRRSDARKVSLSAPAAKLAAPHLDLPCRGPTPASVARSVQRSRFGASQSEKFCFLPPRLAMLSFPALLTVLVTASAIMSLQLAWLVDDGFAHHAPPDSFGVHHVCAACACVIALQFPAGRLHARGGMWVKLHLPRRAQHASSGVMVAGLYWYLPHRQSVLCLVAACLALGSLQALRRFQQVEQEFLRYFGSLLRDEERAGAPPAALSFLFGSLLCVLFLRRQCCVWSLVAGALGDPAAALVGQSFGQTRWPHSPKTVLGSSACCLVSAASAAFLGAPFLLSLLGGVAAATCELLGSMAQSDNIAVLFGSGLLLQMMESSGIAGSAGSAWLNGR